MVSRRPPYSIHQKLQPVWWTWMALKRGIFVMSRRAKAGGTRGHNGQFRHGQHAVQADEAKDDAKFKDHDRP
jgi:hypothetical protein